MSLIDNVRGKAIDRVIERTETSCQNIEKVLRKKKLPPLPKARSCRGCGELPVACVCHLE